MPDLERLRALFDRALARPAGEREAFVRSEAGEELLADQVLALLAEHEAHGRTFAPSDRRPAGLPASGDGIGPYVLRELIGEGGFGIVYRAEQTSPVRRTVALKIIKPGMDTREVIARFDAERQALAMMNHPGIAKVLGGGATERGLPYFVMEYVKGEPITSFADDQRLTVRQRLDLFTAVCDAIQHAHIKGVLHRDIKPSNILVGYVDSRARSERQVFCKIIDFGIAKALNQRLTDQTVYTRLDVLLGTPEFMSPEQFSGSKNDVDTRSDVYSLGVLLYELLSGVRPFDLKNAALDEARRVICETEPPYPTARLTTAARDLTRVADRRRTDTTSLVKLMRGELAWIALKALKKDRAERYDSVADLARDVQRYVSGRPVEAGPDSRWYRVSKFVRRNRGSVAATAIVLVALVGGSTAATYGLWRAEIARDLAVKAQSDADDRRMEAEDALRRTRRAVTFLDETMLGQLNPMRGGSVGMTALEMVDRAAARIESAVGSDQELEYRIRIVIGRAYSRLEISERARDHLERARVIALLIWGDQSLQFAEAERSLAWMDYDAGALGRRLEIAVERMERAYRITRTQLGDTHELTNRDLGDLAMFRALLEGKPAAGLTNESLAMVAFIRGDGKSIDETREEISDLILDMDRLWTAGEPDRAQTLLHDYVENVRNSPIYRERLPYGLSGYVLTLRQEQAPPGAIEAIATYAADWGIKHLGRDHPSTLDAVSVLALVHGDAGRHEEALRIQTEQLPLLQTKFGATATKTIRRTTALARTYARLDQFARAEEELDRIWALAEEYAVPPTDLVLIARAYSWVYERWDEARPETGHDESARLWTTRVSEFERAISADPAS